MRARLPSGLRGLWYSTVDLLPAVDALADAHLDVLAVRLLLPHPDARRPVADRTDDPGAARVALVVDDHGGVLVKRDGRAVFAAVRLLRAHDDRLDDLALL